MLRIFRVVDHANARVAQAVTEVADRTRGQLRQANAANATLEAVKRAGRRLPRGVSGLGRYNCGHDLPSLHNCVASSVRRADDDHRSRSENMSAASLTLTLAASARKVPARILPSWQNGRHRLLYGFRTVVVHDAIGVSDIGDPHRRFGAVGFLPFSFADRHGCHLAIRLALSPAH